MKTTPPTKRRRHFGRNSPLDRLPAKVRREMVRRCVRGDRFREIREWLATQHGRTTSVNALSEWNIRRDESERVQRENGSTGHEPVQRGAARLLGKDFEIHITAPGASEVRVTLRSLAAAKGKAAR